MSNIRANSYKGKGHVSPFNFFSNYWLWNFLYFIEILNGSFGWRWEWARTYKAHFGWWVFFFLFDLKKIFFKHLSINIRGGITNMWRSKSSVKELNFFPIGMFKIRCGITRSNQLRKLKNCELPLTSHISNISIDRL